MPEKVLFESESPRSREEVAAYLRRIADTLEAGDELSLSAGDQSVTMDPPSRPTFEVKAEREGPADAAGELSVEFELEWDEDADEGGELEIG
jgi:amphi-Trp domain-containing protein